MKYSNFLFTALIFLAACGGQFPEPTTENAPTVIDEHSGAKTTEMNIPCIAKGASFGGRCGNGGPVPTYTIGGNVTGLNGTLILDLNGTETLPIFANGNYIFESQLADGIDYAVSVAFQPQNQNCTVSNGAGSIPDANVSNVNVTCADIVVPSITTLTDLVICRAGVCSGSTAGLQNTGSTNISGVVFQMFQRSEEVTEGELYIADIIVTAESFVNGPSMPAGWTWLGSACEVQIGSTYLDCFNIIGLLDFYEESTSATKVVNTKYCVADFWDFETYCQNAPGAIDGGAVYRPRGTPGPPSGPTIHVSNFSTGLDIYHDFFIERVSLP